MRAEEETRLQAVEDRARLQAVEDRARMVADSYYNHADWTCKQFNRILNMIFGLTVVHVLELLLILALLANA